MFFFVHFFLFFSLFSYKLWFCVYDGCLSLFSCEPFEIWHWTKIQLSTKLLSMLFIDSFLICSLSLSYIATSHNMHLVLQKHDSWASDGCGMCVYVRVFVDVCRCVSTFTLFRACVIPYIEFKRSFTKDRKRGINRIKGEKVRRAVNALNLYLSASSLWLHSCLVCL